MKPNQHHRISHSADDPLTDSSFANVELLLHLDGANGSQVWTDSSSRARSVSHGGGGGLPMLDTATKKYGTASVQLPGTNNIYRLRVFAPGDGGFAFPGDYTVEAWVNWTGGAPARSQTIAAVTVNGGLAFVWDGGQFTPGSNLIIAAFGVTNIVVAPWSPSAGTWHHVAACRSGSSVRAFVDGTQVGTTATNSTSHVNGDLSIGGYGTYPFDLSTFAGNIDDLRITKGVARYTSNFTPRRSAFPNS